MIEPIPIVEGGAEVLGDLQFGPKTWIPRHREPGEPAGRFPVAVTRPGPEIGRHRTAQAHAFLARHYAALGTVVHFDQVAPGAGDQPQFHTFGFQGRHDQARGHSLGPSGVVGKYRRFRKPLPQLREAPQRH